MDHDQLCQHLADAGREHPELSTLMQTAIHAIRTLRGTIQELHREIRELEEALNE